MTEKTLISIQLKDAAKKPTRSLAARLFVVIEDVENAISSGVTHEDIVIILNNNDFDFTLESFRNALNYVRNKKRKKALDKSEKQVHVPVKISDKKDTKESVKINTASIDFKALQKLGAQTKKDSKK